MSKYKEILKKYWNYPNFRPLQEDIIKSVADDNKDTLGLLPTGGGKSIIFQVPTLAKDGICIVVTPLIALMKDQVENLLKKNIKAVAIHSGMNSHEIQIALENCIFGNYKFLYLSPERLATELFLAKINDFKVNLIAIDESHCISQWGYDFRPSYLKIVDIRKHLPNIPILALTATATPEVVIDIQEKLGFKQKNVFRKSFERKNLTYIVRDIEDKTRYLLKILNKEKGTGVVYVRNRKKTREIAEFLQKNGISADYYHAGLTPELKDYKQEQWKNGFSRIMVSTNAFGMGIDKSDVRVVVHIDLPDSLEAYFQEAGRGGRDEKRAYAVLLCSKTDIANLKRSIHSTFPEKEIIKKIYLALGNYFQLPIGAGKNLSFEFRIGDFVSNYKFPILVAYNSLKILQRNGYIELTEEIFNPSKVYFTVNRDDLYKFQVANAKFDAFIRILLRTYTGLFNDYVKIDENRLAKITNTSRDVIYEYLKKLSTLGIVNYIPQKKSPFLIFTEERLDEKNLRISKESYDKLKEKYVNRVNAVIEYATNDKICRSRQLLRYFGETETNDCDECDVCRAKKINQLTNNEFNLISEKISELVKKNDLTVKEIVDGIDVDEEKVLKTLKWMLDNNDIYLNKEYRYCIRKKL